MTQREFLKILEKKLASLSVVERQKSLDFYKEMISDKIEEGYTEADAVESLGSIDDIARAILAAAPPNEFASPAPPNQIREATPIREAVPVSPPPPAKERTKRSPAAVVLIILGFPLWFPLLIVGLVLLFSGAIVIFALFLAMFAVLFAFLVGGVCGIISGFINIFTGNFAAGIFIIGGSLMLVSAFFLLIAPVGALEKSLFKLAKSWVRGVTRLFRKEV